MRRTTWSTCRTECADRHPVPRRAERRQIGVPFGLWLRSGGRTRSGLGCAASMRPGLRSRPGTFSDKVGMIGKRSLCSTGALMDILRRQGW